MDRKSNIFDLLLVLSDGNIANLYNVAHQYSTLHPRGKPLIASVLRREKDEFYSSTSPVAGGVLSSDSLTKESASIFACCRRWAWQRR